MAAEIRDRDDQRGDIDMLVLIGLALSLPFGFLWLNHHWNQSTGAILEDLLRELRPAWTGSHRKEGQVKVWDQVIVIPPRLDYGRPSGLASWSPAVCLVLQNMNEEGQPWLKNCL